MARRHHYIFGHQALRQIFFNHPHALLSALMSRREELLKKIWDDIGEDFEEGEGNNVRLSSDGLTCSLHDIGADAMTIIVSLPPPEESPEAYLVGLVFRPPGDLPDSDKGIQRYITLELGMDLRGGEKRTVLCEWTAEMHLNMGDGPEATVEAFARKLAEMVMT